MEIVQSVILITAAGSPIGKASHCILRHLAPNSHLSISTKHNLTKRIELVKPLELNAKHII